MPISRDIFGIVDGKEVNRFTLKNGRGASVQVIDYGASLTAVNVPDRHGRMDNVTLSLDKLEDYTSGRCFMGPIVGRFANRIAKGQLVLDGEETQLPLNEGSNHIHGGEKGFDTVIWEGHPFPTENVVGVVFKYTSSDGEEGYPGNLKVAVTYSLNDANEMRIDLKAETDRTTVLNLTNHASWNLAGAKAGDVSDHQIRIASDHYLAVGEDNLPLGTFAPVAETPLDFRNFKSLGEEIEKTEDGYDHCFVLKKAHPGEFCLAALARDPKTGRQMAIHTTQPGLQLYTGNYLDGSLSSGGFKYEKHYGFSLETQHYPDSPSHPNFPDTTLRPGEIFSQTTLYRFNVV